MAVFVVFALLAVGSALTVIAHKSPIYATLSLVVTLFSVAVLFVLLGAPFIATLQLLIYAGAILVLFLFVIMLLNVGRTEGIAGGHRAQLVTAILGGVVFAGMLAMLLRQGIGSGGGHALTEDLVSLGGLAQELFASYLLPFEIVGLLLLVAVIGATVIARKRTSEEIEAAYAAAGEAAPRHAAAGPTWAAWAEEDERAAPRTLPRAVTGGRAGAAASPAISATAATSATSAKGGER